MIEYKTLDPSHKSKYDRFLQNCGERGCEYNFSNLYLWGRQRAAFHQGNLTFFSQFNRQSIYPFPLAGADLKPTLDAIIHDAATRDIPCRLTSLSADDCALLERLYPGRFRFHTDRDAYDYIYDIHDLADLKGRKYQRKRNHINRFRQTYPDYTVEPLSDENTVDAVLLLQQWYTEREQAYPHADFHMERAAIFKALRNRKELDMEGLLLKHNGKTLAITLGSKLSDITFDVQFEKALDEADGAYPTINQEFARYLRDKYPQLQWLDREDDLGLEGLRKAKLSYYPHHMVEKSWACLLEDGYDY